MMSIFNITFRLRFAVIGGVLALAAIAIALVSPARRADAANTTQSSAVSTQPQAISQEAWLARARATVTPSVDTAEYTAFSVLRQPLAATDSLPPADESSVAQSSIVGALGGNLALARRAESPGGVGAAWVIPGDGALCVLADGDVGGGTQVGGASQLQELLGDLEGLQPTYVIFYDLSRESRDDYDAQWLWREVSKHGCLIQSTRERIDASPSGRFMYSILSAVNAMRSRDDAEKVKNGLQRKFMAGGTMGPARIGYLNHKEWFQGREVAVVVVDPDRADHVRDAFDLYATDQYTLSTLTDILADKGLRTRPTPKKPSRPLSRASVHRLLRDDFYIGIVTFNGQKRRGLHEPLIEETTFERVQQVLAAHRASGDRSHKHEHYLTGRIFICNYCGRRLGYGRHRGKLGGYYEYFSCLSRVMRGGRCNAPYLPVDEVEQAMSDYHASITYTADEQQRMRDAVRDYTQPRVEAAKKDAALHEHRLHDLQAEQQKLIQLSFKELIDDDVLQAEQERITKERFQVIRWREAAAHELDDVMAVLDDALTIVDEHLPYGELDATLRKLINQATHTEIAPYFADDPNGTRRCRIRGQRDPFYIQADRLLGKTPPEAADTAPATQEGNKKTPTPVFRGRGSDKNKMAERAGFEPAMEISPHTRLAGECLQPLGHLSGAGPV